MQTIPRRAASGVNVQLECKSRYNVKSFHAAIAETIRVHGRIFYAFRLVLVLNIQGTFFDFPLCAQRFSGTNTDDVAVLCEGLAHLRRARLI